MKRIMLVLVQNIIVISALIYSSQMVSAGLTDRLPGFVIQPGDVHIAVTTAITATENMLSVCSRHAPKCPLDKSRWPENDDGWQFTGKKWSWYANTPIYNNRITVWEWSQPYSGDTAEYLGHREDQYTDFTNTPDSYLVTKQGAPPVTYDWERWMKDGGNYRMMQLGNPSESESYLVGESDCESGVFYPVVDHILNFAETPMASEKIGFCSKVGYISSVLIEQYGEPGSQTRAEKCNDPKYGVPRLHSPSGNAICNMSPYVGKVYQRYVFGPDFPGTFPTIGCEAVVYAWGWNPPHEPQSGQDYEVWFRNGELRFSRWHGISGLTIPDPDDDEWWNSRCEGAWTEQANWLYTGKFRAGMGVYADRIIEQQKEQFNLSEAGGTVNLPSDSVTYTFPDSAFADDVVVTAMQVFPEEIPLSLWNRVIAGPFRIYAERESDGELLQPSGQYIAEVGFGEQTRNLAENNRVGIYTWNGRQWIKEISSFVNLDENTISAFPNRLQVWAVLAEPYQVYFPRVLTVNSKN